MFDRKTFDKMVYFDTQLMTRHVINFSFKFSFQLTLELCIVDVDDVDDSAHSQRSDDGMTGWLGTFHFFNFFNLYLILYKLNDQNQVFCFLYAIWPKFKDFYPTYLKAIKPPSVWDIHLVTNKTLKVELGLQC